MLPKNAIELLFQHDFGNGPLFKNQIELVNELISNPRSSYYLDNDNEVEYSRGISRLKAYISQLLSDSARRSITPELHESLRTLIKERLLATDFKAEDITNLIVTDIKIRNRKNISTSYDTGNRRGAIIGGFLKEIVSANYISVFTSREIMFEYEIGGEKISFVDLLIQNLIDTLKSGNRIKYYRFNFPLEQTCQLFWRGLRKEIVKYLKSNSEILPTILSNVKVLVSNYNTKELQEPIQYYGGFEERVANELLGYLSKNEIINVFHLKAPVFLVPSVTINPNENNNASTYLFLQSSYGNENLHKLSNEEQLLWKFFVWDNLKKNKTGKSLMYSSDL